MSLTRRDLLVGTGSGLLAVALPPQSPGYAASRAAINLRGGGFGTTWRAVLPAGSDVALVRRRFEAIIASVNNAVSPFHANSELSTFNATQTTDWITVSSTVEAILAEGLRIAAISSGAFEPTIGPLVHRFGFGPINSGMVGTYSEIEVGNGMIRKRRKDLTLDLCGIAKGYALDQMGEALQDLGLRDFIIEFGGEIRACGSHPLGRPWEVGIERPLAGPPYVQRIVRLEEMCLATSGDLVNAFVVAGRRYSHIVDPHTGNPVDNRVASVSVMAVTAMEADALATALFVMGSGLGSQFAARHNIPALFLLLEKTEIRELVVSGFERSFVA